MGSSVGFTTVLERTIPARKEAVQQALETCIDIFKSRMTQERLRSLTVAISEALQNAYEHGCLGIGATEKEAALAGERFEELLSEREPVAAGEKKVISFRIERGDGAYLVTIIDPGQGFDWQQSLREISADQPSNALHGRGLKLILHGVDSVRFNLRGNEITLCRTI